MIVYVESNFLLELALAQEQRAYAEQLLLQAMAGNVTLVIPAFALSEPFATVIHRARERRKLHGVIREQVRDLTRSPLHAGAEATFKPVMETLLQLEHQELNRLTDVVARLLNNATFIDLTPAHFQAALTERMRFSLSVQDAIIYACVIADARSRDIAEPKCFISRHPHGTAQVQLSLCIVVRRGLGRGEHCRAAGGLGHALALPSGWKASSLRPARLAQRGLLAGAAPFVLVQQALAQAEGLGRHFQQFVVSQEVERLLQRESRRRC